MECRFCGKKIKEGSNVCDNCGREVTEGLGTDELIDAMPEIHDDFDKISEMQAKDKKKKEKKAKRAQHKTRRTVIAIVLIIAILAGVAGGMYYLNKGKNDKENGGSQEIATSAIDSLFQKTFAEAGFSDATITDAASAKAVIESAKGAFHITDVEKEFELKSEMKVGGSTIYRFQQVYNGIPVYGGEVVIMADASGYPTAFNAAYVETQGLTTEYKVDEARASAAMTEYVNALSEDYAVVEGVNITEITKAVCNTEDKAYLAYTANVSGYNKNGGYVAYDVFVDGVSGNGICAVITSSYENEAAAEITQEEVATAYNFTYEMATVNEKFNWNDETSEIAEEPINVEDVASGNSSVYVSSVKNSIDNACNYFNKNFGWNGLAGNGESFKVYINSNQYVEETLPAEKAMYTNGKLMFFREDLTQGEVDYNVVVHEYAHGVMENIAGFSGTKQCNENAAIAEGLADVFAELAEAELTGAAPDWVHGTRNLATPDAGYHISTSEAAVIENVQNCYEYSTIVSHMAAFMNGYVGDISVQNEFWFKAMCLMTRNTDFTEFNSIMSAVTANMYAEGKLDDAQYGAISTGIEMLGASEQDLYSTGEAQSTEAVPQEQQAAVPEVIQ